MTARSASPAQKHEIDWRDQDGPKLVEVRSSTSSARHVGLKAVKFGEGPIGAKAMGVTMK